jgi:broad specificity phosphatase PhoE
VTGTITRRLYLVRHGAAAGAEGRAIGHSDLPLSADGRRAVERLAATWLGPPPDRLLTSPLARAAATASLLAAAWGMEPAPPEPRLAEMSFGAWDGRPWDDIHAADRARFTAWADRWWQAPTPDGEGFADLARRVGEWWDEWIAAAAASDLTVAVTHAGPIRALLAARFGMPRELLWDLPVGLARVTALDVLAGEPPRLVVLDGAGFPAPPGATAPAPA